MTTQSRYLQTPKPRPGDQYALPRFSQGSKLVLGMRVIWHSRSGTPNHLAAERGQSIGNPDLRSSGKRVFGSGYTKIYGPFPSVLERSVAFSCSQNLIFVLQQNVQRSFACTRIMYLFRSLSKLSIIGFNSHSRLPATHLYSLDSTQ